MVESSFCRLSYVLRQTCIRLNVTDRGYLRLSLGPSDILSAAERTYKILFLVIKHGGHVDREMLEIIVRRLIKESVQFCIPAFVLTCLDILDI